MSFKPTSQALLSGGTGGYNNDNDGDDCSEITMTQQLLPPSSSTTRASSHRHQQQQQQQQQSTTNTATAAAAVLGHESDDDSETVIPNDDSRPQQRQQQQHVEAPPPASKMKMTMEMESPTSRTMAALSQDVSPVRYTTSPPEEKTCGRVYPNAASEALSLTTTNISINQADAPSTKDATPQVVSKSNGKNTTTTTTTAAAPTWHKKIPTASTTRTPHHAANKKTSPPPPAAALTSTNKSSDSQVSKKDGDSVTTNDDENCNVVHPFCKLCVIEAKALSDSASKSNTTSGTKRPRKPKTHHAWCPKNETSEKGDIKLEIILAGRTLNCPACAKEYKSGKVVASKSHSVACRQNAKRLRQQMKQDDDDDNDDDDEQEQVVTTQKKRKNNAPKPQTTKYQVGTSKRKLGATKKKRRRAASDRDSDSDEDSSSGISSDDEEVNDDTSEYRPMKKSGAIHTIRRSKSLKANKKTASINVKTKKQSNVKSAPKKKRACTTNRATIPPQQKSFRQPHNDPEDNKDGDEEEQIQLKPKWIPVSENPWGNEGYVFGDVVLFGLPSDGVCHPETVLPSARYNTQPFKMGSTYRTTHFTPEQGLSVLLLRRDPMANRPWGFQVLRDEFGGACLVASVDLQSPASAATLVGVPQTWATNAPSPYGLSQNDMLVTINGNQVGGMTVEALAVELESTGSILQLVVARYKHRDDAAKRFASLERQMLDTMDAAARDERLLGWKEIGNGPMEVQDKLQGESNEQSSSTEEPGPTKTSMTAIGDDSRHGARLSQNPATANRDDPPAAPNSVQKDVENDLRPPGSTVRCDKDGKGKTLKLEGEKDEESDDVGSEESSGIHAKLGCICGEIHSDHEDNIFWIQCDGCKSWYDVAEKCVGFSETDVEGIKTWLCSACAPSESEDEGESENRMESTCGKGNVKDTHCGEANQDRRDDCAKVEKEDKNGPHSPSRPDPQKDENQVEQTSLAERAKAASGNKNAVVKGDDKRKDNEHEGDRCDVAGLLLLAEQAEAEAADEASKPSKGPYALKRARTKAAIERLQDNGWAIKRLANYIYVCRSPDGTEVRGLQKALDYMEEHPNIAKSGEGNVDCSGAGDEKKNNEGKAGEHFEDALSAKRRDRRKGTLRPPLPKQKASPPEGRQPRKRRKAPSGTPKKRSKRLIASSSSSTSSTSKKESDASPEHEQSVPDSSPPGFMNNHDFDGFQVGDLVDVEPHSWPGKNCVGGTARIVRCQMDEDQDRYYSVQYVVQRYKEHDIAEEFIRPKIMD